MKQLYEFLPAIFNKNVKDPLVKKQALIVCKDADLALFLMTKERQPLMESVEYDPIKFKLKNGIYKESCKIYLN